jgi:AraC family transcriptional regulator
MTAPINPYDARMLRVLDHIDRNLDCDLDLDAVSGVAAFSKFHFHRQFSATFGVSLHRYVQLARLERASKQLAAGEGRSVTEIALDAGYETPDAFARAFRQRFLQSPSRFRKSPDWEPWLKAFGPLNSARSRIMPTTFTADQVTVREVAPTRVAMFEHRGDPGTLDVTIQKFIAWRTAAGMSPRTHPTFNIWYSERRPPNPADYRMDLCVGIGPDQAIDAADGSVREGEIPGGRCAVLRVTGDTHNLEPAAMYLYREWLPASGEEMRDFPIYCQRFFLDGPGLGTAAELHLPLKSPPGSTTVGRAGYD